MLLDVLFIVVILAALWKMHWKGSEIGSDEMSYKTITT